MNALTLFAYAGHDVRVIEHDGEPWFVAADVAKILGYRMASDMTRRLDEDDRGTRSVRTPSGEQEMTVISEPGLYAAVLGSKVPGSREFKRWVTHDVLPEIRKHGSYGAPALTGPELMAAALIEAQQTLAAKDRELEQARPKAEAFDAFLDADGCYSIGAVAKMLGKSQNRLFDDLRSAGVLIGKGHMRNTPYQKYMHHFRVNAHAYEKADGTSGSSYTTKVRPSGVDFIRRKLGLASAPMLEVV